MSRNTEKKDHSISASCSPSRYERNRSTPDRKNSFSERKNTRNRSASTSRGRKTPQYRSYNDRRSVLYKTQNYDRFRPFRESNKDPVVHARNPKTIVKKRQRISSLERQRPTIDIRNENLAGRNTWRNRDTEKRRPKTNQILPIRRIGWQQKSDFRANQYKRKFVQPIRQQPNTNSFPRKFPDHIGYRSESPEVWNHDKFENLKPSEKTKRKVNLWAKSVSDLLISDEGQAEIKAEETLPDIDAPLQESNCVENPLDENILS
eukprot:GHVP01031720.1.p1 GENE.GHVP01031720.1~~GHVP01031720.1.p1  ORF type:complete len:274 (+),score=39.72 GHVP01031720.1:38-823(+)